jgi:F-type H+-transporting ATPase subunit b
MELVKPSIGLIFWMMLFFSIIFFLLAKFAWPAILKGLKEREESIQNALDAAKKAKEEIASMKADNEKLLAEARNERDRMLREGRDTKDKIIAEARDKAQAEANKIIASARETITNEKNAAVAEIKNQVASMSIEIAEKILRQELSNDDKQKMLASNLMNDINLN